MVDAPALDRSDAVNRIILLILLLPIAWTFEIPSIERAFRFLVVDDNGKTAEGVPISWISEVYVGRNAYGGHLTKEVDRNLVLSDKDGVVEVEKHKFGAFQCQLKLEELKKSPVWMVDSKTNSQFLTWDVYRKNNPEMYALGPPIPGFDAVFKVLSKQGISNLYRYNSRHMFLEDHRHR